MDIRVWDNLKRQSLFYTKNVETNELNYESVFANAKASADGLHIDYDMTDMPILLKARWALDKQWIQTPPNMIRNALLKMILSTCENTFVKNLMRNYLDQEVFLKFIDRNLMKHLNNEELTVFLQKLIRYYMVPKDEIINKVSILSINYKCVLLSLLSLCAFVSSIPDWICHVTRFQYY